LVVQHHSAAEGSMVDKTKDLKSVMERTIKAIKLRPSIGQGTAITTVRIRGGLTADVEDGPWKMIADEGAELGGAGLGPDPGVFTRAGLGSCLAIGYVMWASVMDVPLDSVHVTVKTDYDARGSFAVDDGLPPGWAAVRYTTTISSPAPEARVREMIDYADQHSSVLDIIRRAIPVSGDVKVTSTIEA
jgi:uncharacterized OsmC-like protein